ncbi:hypothetical protein [Nocardioides donggukensis]|nr:hypothetical protein [Nocardioides donggukensis]
MGGYQALPAGMGDEVAADWVARACAHIATLPPKEKKARSRR